MPRYNVARDTSAVLATLGPEVERIMCRTETGQTKWLRRQDILPSKHQICLTDAGLPVTATQAVGRPKKTSFDSVDSDEQEGMTAEALLELSVARDLHKRDDPLLSTIRASPDSAIVLDHVLVGLADVAASLAFEREQAERQGKPVSQLSIRQIAALKATADTYLRRRDQTLTATVDMESPAFARLFSFIMDTFRGALEDAGARAELVETVFAKLGKRLSEENNWSKEAQSRMKGE